MRNFIILFAVVMLISCSVEKKIARKYEGEGRDAVLTAYGEPDRIVDLKNGLQRFIYVEETFIKETTIGTGSFTLDERVSPSFVKVETYRFDINENGEVVRTSYEKEEKR